MTTAIGRARAPILGRINVGVSALVCVGGGVGYQVFDNDRVPIAIIRVAV
jgi:hypothetical protein